ASASRTPWPPTGCSPCSWASRSSPAASSSRRTPSTSPSWTSRPARAAPLRNLRDAAPLADEGRMSSLSHIEKLSRVRLEDLLVEEGLLDRARVEEAQAEQERSGSGLGQVLVAKEILTDYDLAKLVTIHYALPYLDVSGFSTRREMLALLPVDFCKRHGILPLDQFGSVISLAVAEMPAPEVIDEIVRVTDLT